MNNNLLGCLGLLLCYVSCDTLTGVMGFGAGSGVVGTDMHPSQLAALQDSIRNSTGNPAVVVEAGKWEASPSGGLQISYKAVGIPKENADSVRLATALMPDKLNTDVNGAISNYYKSNPAPAGVPALGKIEKTSTNPSTELSTTQQAQVAGISGFVGGKVRLQIIVDSMAGLLAGSRSTVAECMRQTISKVTTAKVDNIEIAQIVGFDSKTIEFAFNLTRLSVPQEEGMRAALGPFFDQNFTVKVKLCPNIAYDPDLIGGRRLLAVTSTLVWNKPTTNVTFVNVTSTVRTNLYVPAVYVPSDDTTNLHGLSLSLSHLSSPTYHFSSHVSRLTSHISQMTSRTKTRKNIYQNIYQQKSKESKARTPQNSQQT